MRGESPDRNIFLENSGETKKIAFVHAEDAAEKAAEDIARDEMSAPPEDIKVESWKDYFKHPLKSIGKKSKQIWKYNLGREYYEEKAKQKALKDIHASGSLYKDGVNDNRDSHGKAMGAIVERFVEGADTEIEDELIHRHAGEDVRKLESNATGRFLKEEIKSLIRRYASGELVDRGAFEAARQERFAELSGTLNNMPKEMLGHGVEYADNLFRVAEMAKDAVRHGVAVERLDLEFDIVIGKAKAGARTEAQQNALEKGLNWAKKKSYLAPLVNETTILAATALVTSVKKISQSLARSKAAAWATFGGSAAFGAGLAGITENKRLKQERAQIAREEFAGRTGRGERRDKVGVGNYEQIHASTFLTELAGREAALDAEPSMEKFNDLVHVLSEINARINISDRDKIDLIKSHDEESGETESLRTALDLARAKIRVKLRRMAGDPASGITLPPGQTPDQYINDWVSRTEGNIRGGEISAKDKAFNSMKRKEVGKKMAWTFASGVAFGSAFQQGIAWSKDALGWGGGRPETALEHGWHAVKGVFKKSPEVGGVGTFGGPVETNIGFNGSHAIEAKIPSNTHVEWHGNKFDLLENGTNKHLVDNLALNPDDTWTQESVDALKANHFDYALETAGTGTKTVTAAEYWKDKLSEHKRADWHDEPGKRYSEFFRKLIQFEGKQQMLYLKRDANGAYMDVEAVYDNLVKNADYALKTFGKNPDGSVDTKLQHLASDLKLWKSNGTLWEHLKGAIIPTDEANKQGLSMMVDGQAATPGKIYFSKEISDMMTNPANLKDKGLPFRFLELRLDGHVLATAQGHSLESMVVPAESPMPIVTPIGSPEGPHDWRFPDFVPVNGRRPLEKADPRDERPAPGPVVGPPLRVGPRGTEVLARGEVFPYGGYERNVEERGDYYRDRFSPDFKNNPEAHLDFDTQSKWYFEEMKKNNPEYFRDLMEILKQPGVEVKMSEKCRVSVCVPVYTLGEGKIVQHALDEYRKQIENKSVDPDEFEILLFLNHPKDKREALEMLPGAALRVKNGNPEAYDTEEVINQYIAAHPEMNIRVMKKEFEERPKWGWIIKYLYDAACYRAAQRTNAQDKDLAILTNDVDVRDVSDKYLRFIIDGFDQNSQKAQEGSEVRVDGIIGRIDHDNSTYEKWPNFFAVTRFDQFIDAQRRYGITNEPQLTEEGYVLDKGRKGEKVVITQGRNTALRGSAYCAIGGANVNTDAGADTELGGMVRHGRRGATEKLIPHHRNPFKYMNKAWLETDPRRELGMYKKGEPVATAWKEWDQMNVYGKNFHEQIEGDQEQLSPERMEQELNMVLWKWGLDADSEAAKRALAWLGLEGKDKDGHSFKDYSLIDDPENPGKQKIKVKSLSHLKDKIDQWKPKRLRVEEVKAARAAAGGGSEAVSRLESSKDSKEKTSAKQLSAIKKIHKNFHADRLEDDPQFKYLGDAEKTRVVKRLGEIVQKLKDKNLLNRATVLVGDRTGVDKNRIHIGVIDLVQAENSPAEIAQIIESEVIRKTTVSSPELTPKRGETLEARSEALEEKLKTEFKLNVTPDTWKEMKVGTRLNALERLQASLEAVRETHSEDLKGLSRIQVLRGIKGTKVEGNFLNIRRNSLTRPDFKQSELVKALRRALESAKLEAAPAAPEKEYMEAQKALFAEYPVLENGTEPGYKTFREKLELALSNAGGDSERLVLVNKIATVIGTRTKKGTDKDKLTPAFALMISKTLK